MSDKLNTADKLALELTDLFIDLNGFTAATRRRVASMLRVLEGDLIAKLAVLELEAPESIRRKRIERLIRDVQNTIDRRYVTAEARMKAGMREIAVLANDGGLRAIAAALTIDIASASLTRPDLKALADVNVVLGEPAKDWWAGQAQATRRRFARQMRIGIMSGESNDQLISRVRGKPTGRTIAIEQAGGKFRRIREFQGGFLDVSRREADALVRTSAQSVSNAALMENYQANGDVIKGVEAITTLDEKTSLICIARTGAAWYLNGDPIPESTTDEPFPGPPPWHFRCRSLLSPITYSWDELIDKAGGQKLKTIRTVPDSERASMDGLIGTGSVRSFDDWLRIKGDAFARKRLGPGRFDLWKSGRLTLSQLIDSAGNPLPLSALRAL